MTRVAVVAQDLKIRLWPLEIQWEKKRREIFYQSEAGDNLSEFLKIQKFKVFFYIYIHSKMPSENCTMIDTEESLRDH